MITSWDIFGENILVNQLKFINNLKQGHKKST